VLIVSFGGRAEGFNFRGVVTRLGVDGLFFRDGRDDWYLSGVHGVSSEFVFVCAFIRDVIERRTRRHVLFMGQSSGGYAALRFAHELAVRHVPPDGIEHLGALYRSRPSRTRVEVHMCSSEADNPPHQYFWDDERHVGELAGVESISVTRHPCRYHPVAYHLNDTGELDQLLRDVIDRS
jgi:hypothetical protein